MKQDAIDQLNEAMQAAKPAATPQVPESASASISGDERVAAGFISMIQGAVEAFAANQRAEIEQKTLEVASRERIELGKIAAQEKQQAHVHRQRILVIVAATVIAVVVAIAAFAVGRIEVGAGIVGTALGGILTLLATGGGKPHDK